jgi:hypothetical protein
MGIIETLQAEIQSLKERVTALEQQNAKKIIENIIDRNPFYKRSQLTRDDIIEMAKRDVAELKKRMAGYDLQNEGNRYFREFKTEVDFIVNKEKRTVVALLRHYDIPECKDVLSRGIAKCHPDDCFNAHIGRAIALRRALGLEVPKAYLNASQPTEVRVGDVVKWSDGSIYRIKNISGKEYTFEKLNEKFESIRFISRVPYPRGIEKFSKVIDDSRDEV